MQPWRPNSAVMAAAATRASGSGRGGGTPGNLRRLGAGLKSYKNKGLNNYQY